MIFEGNENISENVKLKLEEIERHKLLEPDEARVREIMDQDGLEREEAEKKAIEEKFSPESVQRLEDAIEPRAFIEVGSDDGQLYVDVKVVDGGRHNNKLFDVRKELPFVQKPTYQEKQDYAALSTDSERIDFLASKLGLTQ